MYWSIPERPPRVNRITGKCSRYPCSKKLRSSWFWPIVSYTVIYTYCMITSDVQSVSGQSQSNGWGSLVYWNLSGITVFRVWSSITGKSERLKPKNLMLWQWYPWKIHVKIHEHGVLIMTFPWKQKKDQNFQHIGGARHHEVWKWPSIQARCPGHPSGPYPTSGTRRTTRVGGLLNLLRVFSLILLKMHLHLFAFTYIWYRDICSYKWRIYEDITILYICIFVYRLCSYTYIRYMHTSVDMLTFTWKSLCFSTLVFQVRTVSLREGIQWPHFPFFKWNDQLMRLFGMTFAAGQAWHSWTI